MVDLLPAKEWSVRLYRSLPVVACVVVEKMMREVCYVPAVIDACGHLYDGMMDHGRKLGDWCVLHENFVLAYQLLGEDSCDGVPSCRRKPSGECWRWLSRTAFSAAGCF